MENDRFEGLRTERFRAYQPAPIDYDEEWYFQPVFRKLWFLVMFAVVFVVSYKVTGSVGDVITVYNRQDILPIGGGGDILDETQQSSGKLYDMSWPYMTEIVDLIPTYPEAEIIADNIIDIPQDLIELVLKNHETINFVANYLEYGENTYVPANTVNVSYAVEEGVIPHFIQWDQKWGYSLYGTQIMGLNGCGPTALSMVAVGLSGNTDYNPRYVADFSQENGYITADNSTTWTLMSVGSKELGLTPKELTLDANVIIGALTRGEPIIATVGPGDFTQAGHFIVMVGVTEEGKILVNDPNSYINTNAEWDLQRIIPQIKNLWSFTAR